MYQRRAARWVRLSDLAEKIPFSRRNSSAHRAAAVRSGACCIFPTERHCSVERERCLLKEIRLLISALENALPLPRSHRRSHRRRAAAASTAGHRRTRLPHCSLYGTCATVMYSCTGVDSVAPKVTSKNTACRFFHATSSAGKVERCPSDSF